MKIGVNEQLNDMREHPAITIQYFIETVKNYKKKNENNHHGSYYI